MIRCNIGGDYIRVFGGWESMPPCPEPPTVRYQPRADKHCPDRDHWNYRCAKHAAWLDKTFCRIERL